MQVLVCLGCLSCRTPCPRTLMGTTTSWQCSILCIHRGLPRCNGSLGAAVTLREGSERPLLVRGMAGHTAEGGGVGKVIAEATLLSALTMLPPQLMNLSKAPLAVQRTFLTGCLVLKYSRTRGQPLQGRCTQTRPLFHCCRRGPRSQLVPAECKVRSSSPNGVPL